MVDALVDGVAVIVNFIVRSSDRFWYDSLCFVSEEAINRCISIGDKVKTFWLKLFNASNAVSDINDVFF